MRNARRVLIAVLFLGLTPSLARAQQTPVCVIINGACASASNPVPTTGTATLTGATSNASSAVATSATNVPTVSFNYVFNGATWDQLSSLTLGSKHAPTVAIVDGSGNQITSFGGGSASNASSGVATSSTNSQSVSWLYGFNGATWDQLQVDGSKNLKVVETATQLSLGNVGGLTKTVCVAPTVTNGTYAANVVVGGLLTFSNLFTSTGHGVIQAAALNFTTAQTVGFKLYPFRGSPTNASTWTDHSAAAITGSADIFLTDQPIQLANPDSGLSATMTNYGAIGLGQAYNPAGTSGFFVLVPTATTASLGGTSSVVQVCITVLQDS